MKTVQLNEREKKGLARANLKPLRVRKKEPLTLLVDMDLPFDFMCLGIFSTYYPLFFSDNNRKGLRDTL